MAKGNNKSKTKTVHNPQQLKHNLYEKTRGILGAPED